MTIPPAAAETLWTIGSFPITNALLNAWAAVAFFVIVAGLIKIGVRWGVFPRFVRFAEAVVEWLLSETQKVTGDRERAVRFLPIAGGAFLLILFSNWLGQLPGTGTVGVWRAGELIPLLRPATSDVNFTLALAIGAVVASHAYGLAALGFVEHASKFVNVRGVWRAIRHGPMAILVALVELAIGFIEIVSELAKVLSLCLRLFGNVFAGEVLMAVILGLFAYAVPLPFIALELLVGAVQATVFAMLTLSYLTVATDKREHEEEERDVEEAEGLAIPAQPARA